MPSSGAPPTSGTTNPPASNGVGSSGSETGSSGPVGLAPSPGASPSQGAAGSSMTAPGTNDGAGGSSFEPNAPGGEGEPVDPAMPPAPAPNAACAGQFICDGFENAAPGASPDPALWQVIADYAPREQSPNVQVSAGNSRSGGQALRVVGASSRNGIVAGLPAQTYFVRAFIRADAVPLGPVFIGLGTDQNSETRLRISQGSSAVINTVGPGDAVHPGAATSGNCADCVALVPNQWFCAELFIDNAARNATLWIDGVEAASIVNGEGGWPVQPAAPQLFLGSMGLQGGQTAVWIDDVAAGPQRIGCN